MAKVRYVSSYRKYTVTKYTVTKYIVTKYIVTKANLNCTNAGHAYLVLFC